MPQHAPGGEHRQFRIGRGARCGAEDRDVVAFGGVDQSVVKPGLARGAVASQAGELVGLHQARIVVFTHAARIGIDDVLESGRAVGQRQQLVDLFFVLGEYQFGFAVAQQISGFFVEHIAIEPERHRADSVGGDLSGNPVRPVVADDADDVATAKAEFDHAEREVVHAGLIVVPGEFAPQPKILFAQRNLAAVFLGIEAQQLRIGIGLGDAAGVIHHAALSAGDSAAVGASSGSTRTSSSSPK